MSTVAAPRLAPSEPLRDRLGARARTLARPRPELAALLALAALLNLWAVGRNGWANEYYSAAVRSMSSSRHAFLYGPVRLPAPRRRARPGGVLTGRIAGLAPALRDRTYHPAR